MSSMTLHQLAKLYGETPAVLVRQNGAYTGVITRYDILHQVAGIR